MKKPIVVVGSINIDLVASCPRMPLPGETVSGSSFGMFPGGKGANQAVAIARLGYPVRIIGCLGEDGFGAQIGSHLEKEGVDLTGVTAVQGSSGVAVIVVSNGGENSIVVVEGANAYLTPQYLESHIEIIRSAGLVLTQLEIPTESVEHLAEICSRADVPLILDPAPARELSAHLFRQVKWFTPKETEAVFFLRNSKTDGDAIDPASIARTLLSKGASGVLLKMGAEGAYLATAAGLSEPIAPYAVEAVDTTAAGDVFNGAFATALMLGNGAVDSARLPPWRQLFLPPGSVPNHRCL
jgi:ribokinase